MKKVGIIGAGPSGLCAVRHCIREGFEVIAFEQNSEIGGEWNYTGAVGVNKYGIDTHSSIYDGLVTNLPKEVMTFPDFPFDENEKESFLTPQKVQNYLLSYADAFQLRQHIKFEHQVVNVHPIANTEEWQVLVRDLLNESLKVFQFDFIFVCNGISVPLIPTITGQDVFKGQVMHSHDYRNSKSFRNEQVLVIGSGPSALDIVLQVGEVAERVFWVHKIKEAYKIDIHVELPETVEQKARIKSLTFDGAKFIDESEEKFTRIIYATGFHFSYPFLSVDSGLSVDDKKVYPLYKHCININKPSLAIIGLPFKALAIPMFDLQVRFCLKYWTKRRKLPAKSEMMNETDNDFQQRREMGYGNHKMHYMGEVKQAEYYVELASAANVEALKPVLGSIYDDVLSKIFDNYSTFREIKYKIVNDSDFMCE